MGRVRNSRYVRLVLNILSVTTGISLILSYLSPFIPPSYFPSLPLFGLAYPVIIVVFIILMFLQLFINKWWSAVMFAIILLGGNLHFRTFTLGSGDDPGNAKSYKLMSYNVHLFDVYNGNPEVAEVTRRKIIQFLNDEQPDIVCFQEFYHQDKPTNFSTKDTIIPLLKIENYQERYAHRRAGRKNFGIAIFTKFPIVQKGEVNFNPDRKSFNYAIYSDIVMGKDTVRVYNIHLQSIKLNSSEKALLEDEETDASFFGVLGKIKSSYPIRASQTELLLRHIRKSPYPVVVCGDFNDTPMSFVYNQFNGALTDAFRNCRMGIGKTYAGKIPAGRIDYIFHSESIGSHDFKIQNEALSDHYAISCKIFTKK